MRDEAAGLSLTPSERGRLLPHHKAPLCSPVSLIALSWHHFHRLHASGSTREYTSLVGLEDQHRKPAKIISVRCDG